MILKQSEKTICFINSNKVWGGGEKWHYEFSLRLLKKGYRVIAVTNYNSDLFFKFQATGITLLPLRISNLSFLNPFKILKLYLFLKRNGISVVFLGLSSDVKLGGIASKLAKINKIIYRRGSAVPVKNSFLNRFLYKQVLTGVIVNSLEIKSALLQNNPSLIADSKIHLLYNCIDLKAFSNPKPFKYQKLHDDEVWLGNVGRFVEQKGQRYLIDLAGILKDKNIKFKLFLAGKGQLEHMLKEYTKSRNLENEIVFLGFVPDIDSFMDSMDIFLLTSIHEGSANVLLEAMACGKPVVAFEVSSISEIVRHNHTGFLAEFKNVQNLSEYTERLIKDPELRRQLGMNGKKRIREEFNVEKAMEELVRIIEQAL